MSTSPLLVPMHVDAMVLNRPAAAATSFLRFEMNYGELDAMNDPDPDPFAGGADKPPAAGIHLHWTLPKALRHGTHNTESGETDFPLIPNRWLVSRIEAGAAPDRAVKSWIVESDHVDPLKGSSPFYLDPRTGDLQGTPSPTRIGRKLRLSADLKTLAVQKHPFLRAIGPGNVHFTVYSPGVMNVLAFHDDLTGLDDATPVAAGTFTYNVVGWHSDPACDPLAQTKWNAGDQEGSFANDSFDWTVLAAAAELPSRMLVHGLAPDLAWRPDQDSEAPPNFPEHVPSTVRVAVGHTAIDALAAMIALETGKESEGELLAAFSYGLLEQYDRAGSREALAAERHRHQFAASPGGTVWSIVAAERDGSGDEKPVVLTTEQKTALATLNTRQDEFDRQQRILQSMQWNLRALWWKNRWQQQNNPPVHAEWLTTQLPLQVGEASSEASGWYIDKVRAQSSVVAQREAEVENAKAAITLDPKRQRLKARNAPSFHHPNDPVLLISGLGRSTNFDPIDGVTCRLATQTIAALTVDGASYPLAANARKPLLADPNGLLPDGVQQLHAEAVILSPQLFASTIGASSADAVTQAYQTLSAAAPGAAFAPPPFAAGPWQQPWVPLLLDWQVVVVRDPAYRAAPDQPTCTLRQERWQFDGMDYAWAGPTKADGDDFDASEDQMQLQGRTFLTPYLSFTLADQLHEYLKRHKGRDPDLQALLADIDSHMQALSGKDLLSQRLSGLLSMMVQRSPRAHAAPTGAVAEAVGAVSGRPQPWPNAHSTGAAAVWDFAPMAGTFFVLKKLSVIDSFGRTIDLMRANNSTAPAIPGTPLDSYFRPIAAHDMKAATTQDPVPGLPQTRDLTERVIKLPPRLIQDSQLSFRLISNDASGRDIERTAEVNPVCGWVIANHLDRSLAFYAPDGGAWGELYLALTGKGGFERAWQPDPTNPNAPQSLGDIPNEFVRRMLQKLWDRTDDGAGIDDLLRVIDDTLWTVVPQGRRKDEDPAVLIGRPLAIVRAELSLRLRGLPYASQDWQNTFRSFDGDADAPVEIGAADGGVLDQLWPVRIGSETLRHDGTIGYFADDPQTPDASFNAFNCVARPATATSDYVRQIGRDGNYPRLRFVDDSVVSPDAKRNQRSRLTLLVDPRCSIHAVSGLVPAVALDIPSEFVGPALKRMAFTFRAGPLLTPPDALRIPFPAAAKGAWSWFDKASNATVALAPADGRSRIADLPPRAVEGWLKFEPEVPEDRREQ